MHERTDNPAFAHAGPPAAVIEHKPLTPSWLEDSIHSGALPPDVVADAGATHRMLVNWLNATAPQVLRPGSRVALIGCALVRNAIELVNRGYDTVAIDPSVEGVRWAQTQHPALADLFVACELTEIPSRFRHRFELVIDGGVLASSDSRMQDTVCEALAQLTAPRGLILSLFAEPMRPARGRSAFDNRTLDGLLHPHGFRPRGAVDEFVEHDPVERRCLRGAFVRT